MFGQAPPLHETGRVGRIPGNFSRSHRHGGIGDICDTASGQCTMNNLQAAEIWYVTGSQHLYGEKTLKQVAANSQKIVAALNAPGRLPLKIVFKPVLTTPDEIRQLCLDATHSPTCAGLILWMHTFSPSKMWIGGMANLRKPFLHLPTQ